MYSCIHLQLLTCLRYVVVTLTKNYRSHRYLVDYSSDLFYEKRLIAASHQPMHQNWHPLTFLAACGESVQSKYGVGYSNQAEVLCLVDGIKHTMYVYVYSSQFYKN